MKDFTADDVIKLCGATVQRELTMRHSRREATSLLRDRVRTVQASEFKGHRLVVGVAEPDPTLDKDNVVPIHGMTTVAAMAFQSLRADGQMCLWLDLNDVGSTDDLFEQLLDAIFYANGTEEWMPSIFKATQLQHTEIRRATLASGRQWVVFLNGLETAGSNFSDGLSATPNGWLDHPTTSPGAVADDVSASTESFIDLLYELTGPECAAVTIVLLCQSAEKPDEPTPLLEKLEAKGNALYSGCARSTWVMPRGICASFNQTSRK